MDNSAPLWEVLFFLQGVINQRRNPIRLRLWMYGKKQHTTPTSSIQHLYWTIERIEKSSSSKLNSDPRGDTTSFEPPKRKIRFDSGPI